MKEIEQLEEKTDPNIPDIIKNIIADIAVGGTFLKAFSRILPIIVNKAINELRIVYSPHAINTTIPTNAVSIANISKSSLGSVFSSSCSISFIVGFLIVLIRLQAFSFLQLAFVIPLLIVP